jgi:very-short-patch-repair endonuclease
MVGQMVHQQRSARADSQHWAALRSRVRELRSDATTAETKLWEALRARHIGAKFRRQHPIHGYVVDFYCPEARLAIEIDGPVHATTGEHDAARQKFREQSNVRFLRFSNDDVMGRLQFVVKSIRSAMQSNDAS